jgi:L-amino acid N-acyltransferase YncA
MKSEEIIVRPSREEDCAIITDIYAHSVLNSTASLELEAPSLGEMRLRRDLLLAHDYPYLVAEWQSQGAPPEVVGFAYAGPYRTRPAYRATVEDSIYIAEKAQRRGVGKILLAALMAACEARGFRQMVAVIGDDRLQGSVVLHQSFGFEMVGVFKNIGFKQGHWLNTPVMQRALGDGASEPLPDTYRRPL